jgi:hypothetical protein
MLPSSDAVRKRVPFDADVRQMPKFNFRDYEGSEWRIRRERRIPIAHWRWRIEQRTGAQWVRRAAAPTRKLAIDRMKAFWPRF